MHEIKQQFKTNQFEVGLISAEKNNLLEKIETNFQIEKIKESAIENELRMVVRLKNNETSKDLIGFLNNNAQINHFTEIIPSANDIFLQAVASNN